MNPSNISDSVDPRTLLTMMTPINASHAFTFGMPRRNVSAFCIKETSISDNKGLWAPDGSMAIMRIVLLQLSMATLLTSTCKFLLRPFGQPTIVAQVLSGIIGGSSVIARNKRLQRILFPFNSLHLLETISSFGLMFFLFLVGVRMDINLIRRARKKEWLIGLSIFILPMLLILPASAYLGDHASIDQNLKSKLTFVALLHVSSTFQGVACFLEDLKILNSELGRLAISSSMISGFLYYIALLIAFSVKTSSNGKWLEEFLFLIFSATAQITFICVMIRPFFIWIIKQAPEAQPIREVYHCFIFLLVLGSSFISEVLGQHGFFGAMLLGLILPDGSVLAASLMDKVDCFVSLVILPLHFLGCGVKTDLAHISARTFFVVNLIALLAFAAKVIGTILPAVFFCDMIFRDAYVLGLIMSTVGILDIQFYSTAIELGCIDDRCFTVMNTSVMLVTGVISPLVRLLYDPSIRYVAYSRRTVQESMHNMEFLILVCVHNEEHVPNIINLLEVTNPTRESPMCVYLLHLVELVGRASPLLVAHQTFRKHGHCLYKPTESIINAFSIFEQCNNSIVTVQPFTAVAPISTMHNDICTLALDRNATLLIIPFHLQWSSNNLVTGSSKFRNMNLKVLQKAPCSVGILIDHGTSGGPKSILGGWSLYRIGVFFIGGPDDREAVAYATRMATHPNVTVTVVGIVAFDEQIDNVMERRLDNDTINEFRQANIGSQKNMYKEEIVTDAPGTCSTILSMENSFDLILVGRRTESPLLQGMEVGNEFPELGFISGLLISEDFKGKVSVLVVQQHECKEEKDNEESRREKKAVLRHQNSFAPLASSSGRY